MLSLVKWIKKALRKWDIIKESFSVTIKLLLCDLEILNSNRQNSLLQNKVSLYTVDLSPKLHIDKNFMYQIVLFKKIKYNTITTKSYLISWIDYMDPSRRLSYIPTISLSIFN